MIRCLGDGKFGVTYYRDIYCMETDYAIAEEGLFEEKIYEILFLRAKSVENL